MITYSKTDISWDLARDAHYATSFTPEKRADQEIEGYMAEMAEMIEIFSPFATDENRALWSPTWKSTGRATSSI